MSERLYAFLLRAYPADFRDEYGAELRHVFRDGLRQRGASIWPRILADLARTAMREHLDVLLQDVRAAVRFFVANPGFFAVAVVCLGLGIGANTAMFSILNGLLFARMPADAPERLFTIDQSGATQAPGASYLNFVDFQKQARSFSGLILSSDLYTLRLGTGAQTAQVSCEMVADNYFRVLGIQAALGRTFFLEEATQPVVVIGNGLWKRRFGADPDVLGRAITVNSVRLTVIGVAPENFHGTLPPWDTAMWVPIGLMPRLSSPDANTLENRFANCCVMGGRLASSISPAQAEAELQTIDRQLREAYPRPDASRTPVPVIRLIKMQGVTVSFIRKWIVTMGVFLMAVLGLVLLISCANVANMLLARAATRRREIAIRLALGARRSRLVRQLLTEGALLSVAGAAAALVLAFWTQHALAGMPAYSVPAGVDFKVLAFSLLLAVATTLLSALAPALHASRPDLIPALKEGSRNGAPARRFGARGLLVVGQIAVSFVLLIAAGLFLRSLASIESIDPGFNTAHTFFATIDVSERSAAERTALAGELQQRVSTMRGIVSASVANHLPLDLSELHSEDMIAEGHDPPVHVEFSAVALNYFETLEIPLVNGRVFDDRDGANSTPVAVINATMARRTWPDENPIGKRIRIGNLTRFVIGVAGDGKYRFLAELPTSFVYIPLSQASPAISSKLRLVVRTSGDPRPLIQPALAQLQSIDPNLPVLGVKTMTTHLHDSLNQQSITSGLLAVFGLLALGLACVGIYGVISHAVAQRTHEIGVRMAIGAGRGGVLRMILKESVVLAAAGIAIGAPIAVLAARLLKSFLYGVSSADPVTFFGIATVWLAVAILAAWLPAQRATRVDPLTALRSE